MRKIHRHPHRILAKTILALIACATQAFADDTNFYQSNTQYGVSLPNTALPSGFDEVRAADGTSCRSAVGGDGAYIDTGVIGSPGRDSSDFSGAVYTRLVVPLGGRKRRLDCASIYELEIQRLKMELDLARMGLSGEGASTSAGNFQEGWSNERANIAPLNPVPIKPAPAKPAKSSSKATSSKPLPKAELKIATLNSSVPVPASGPPPLAASLIITADTIY